MLERFQNSLLYCFISLVVASVAGVIMLTAAYSLPIEKIRKNTAESLNFFYDDCVIDFIITPRSDYFTDSLMMNTASLNTDKIPFIAALLNSRYDARNYMETNLYLSLKQDIIPKEENVTNYPRYWHGYLVYLKPLLACFDLSEIRIIYDVVQAILLFYVLFLFYKRLGLEGIFAFAFVVVFLNPSLMGYCLEYSGIYFILLVSLIILLSSKNENNWKIFLWTGIATPFLDFLTFPLVPIGTLLITSILLYDTDIKKNIILTVTRFIAWITGYFGMWSCKWIIASIFTPVNVIKDAFEMVIYRMFGDGSKDGVNLDLSFFDGIKSNWNYINGKSLWITLICFTVLIILIELLAKKKWKNNWNSLLILLIGLMPFAWYLLVVEHSVIHPFIVHRNLAVSGFAILAFWISSFKKKPLK